VSEAAFSFRWMLAVRSAGLGLTETAVALALATYANADGSRAFPGIKRLAGGIGASERTVERSLRKLTELGYLHKDREGNRRRGLADEYRLTLPGAPPAQSEADDPWSDQPTLTTDQPTLTTRSTDSVSASTDSHDRSTDTESPHQSLDLSLHHSLLPVEDQSPTTGDDRGSPSDGEEDESWWENVLTEVQERDRSYAEESAYIPRWRRLR
jgi:DNA-binding transcriptional ArsR family regulator